MSVKQFFAVVMLALFLVGSGMGIGVGYVVIKAGGGVFLGLWTCGTWSFTVLFIGLFALGIAKVPR